jgi:site-specific DNA-cytosine methylase
MTWLGHSAQASDWHPSPATCHAATPPELTNQHARRPPSCHRYLATFGNLEVAPLDNISRMGTDARVARAATIIFCGFCCKPFSCAGLGKGFEDERWGDNFDLVVRALSEREERGLWDQCLICENVPTFLNHLSVEHLEQLGWFVKIFVVAGSHFRCASSRLRLVLVAFRDKAALARFTPPPPQANAPTPLCTVLKPFSMATGRTAGESLFIEANKFNMASERSHVVSRGYLHGAHSFTSSYGSLQTPGTLLCEAAEYSTRETPLSVAEIKHLSTGELRRLHPTELLAAFSFGQHELPQLMGPLGSQYAAEAP